MKDDTRWLSSAQTVDTHAPDRRMKTMPPMRIKKKPVEVEGMRFQRHNGYEVMNWMRSYGANAIWDRFSESMQSIDIVTLEGTMTADLGDIIIKGVDNEFYPCKPDIFDKTYEVLENAPEHTTEDSSGS